MHEQSPNAQDGGGTPDAEHRILEQGHVKPLPLHGPISRQPPEDR